MKQTSFIILMLLAISIVGAFFPASNPTVSTTNLAKTFFLPTEGAGVKVGSQTVRIVEEGDGKLGIWIVNHKEQIQYPLYLPKEGGPIPVQDAIVWISRNGDWFRVRVEPALSNNVPRGETEPLKKIQG